VCSSDLSHEALAAAELVLHVLDHAEPLTPEDARRLEECAGRNRIVVVNKADLPGRLELPPALRTGVVPVSCVDGRGLESLKDAIKAMVWSGEARADMSQVTINSRHQYALRRARAATEKAIAALQQNLTLELAAFDLRVATDAVGEIVGKTGTEDLLDSIFSQFCIGK
jgi:tRNA modification GTPase